MNKKNNLIILILAVLLFTVLLLPIKYPISISSRGKLLPIKTWTLSRDTNGRLLTYLNNNSTGINDEFSVTQFERGDAVQFKFNANVINENFVNKGDTIGYVISNEIEKNIEKLKGELATAKASLNVQTSSEKESVIDAEKSKLDFAEKELEEQTKNYERKKKLFERNLISQQEFETDEATYELAKININIAKERLRTVQSGAKKEEINFAKTQISALENEIGVLRKRYESNNIVLPISGIVSRMYSSDTLLVVNDTSQFVVLIPVKWEEIKKLNLDQKVIITAPNIDNEIVGKVNSISNEVKTLNVYQYVLVTAISDKGMNEFKPGLYVDCEIECKPETAWNVLVEFFKKSLANFK